MPDSPKLSRRDWFRLRVPQQQAMLDQKQEATCQADESSIPATQNKPVGLQPIEHPPNHDGMDMSQLPPMREATLSAEQITALFSDISQLGQAILLMQRATDAQRADASRVDTNAQLKLAMSSLLSGEVQRLQIRYRWQDQLWIDTLKSETGSFHLVRIAHQNA